MNYNSGYSGKPLIRKLGIKERMVIYILNEPVNYFSLIGNLPSETAIKKKLTSGIDFIHLFFKNKSELLKVFKKTRKYLKINGMLWVSWPKKNAGINSDLNEKIIREIGLCEGMVDIKVCSVDETWSALKFVYRLKDR